MRVLLGCEYTGVGRRAFLDAGHDAWSCDLDPAEDNDPRHFQCDIFLAINRGPWDLIILHPECTKMAVCGNRHWAGKSERREAVEWTLSLWEHAKAHAPRVCLENPQSVIFPVLRNRGADVQYVQPWWFGHPETKKTGLALHNLSRLEKTDDVYDEMMALPKKERHKIWYMSPSRTRGKDRSRSYPGILAAMAEQWGSNE